MYSYSLSESEGDDDYDDVYLGRCCDYRSCMEATPGMSM